LEKSPSNERFTDYKRTKDEDVDFGAGIETCLTENLFIFEVIKEEPQKRACSSTARFKDPRKLFK
jgi:acetone carboxylase gamma subunit